MSYVDTLACSAPVSQLLAVRGRVAALKRVAAGVKFGVEVAYHFLHALFRLGRALRLLVTRRMVSVHVREETVDAIRGGSFVTDGVAAGGYIFAVATARKRRVSSSCSIVEPFERIKCIAGLVKSPGISGGGKLGN